MEKFSKEIGLLGISNSNVADDCEDGACCDIVNMRNNNGIWRVCGMPEKIIECENSMCKFVHCNNDYSHLISYDGKQYIGKPILKTTSVSKREYLLLKLKMLYLLKQWAISLFRFAKAEINTLFLTKGYILILAKLKHLC